MSQYTTGEIAKLCGVTVRTVQYYDQRGILIPAELSEGGRRLYSDDDLKRMRVICFLRGLGIPIEAISQLLSEEDPGSVISLLLEQQEGSLKEEIGALQEKLEKLEHLQRELKSSESVSVESIGDIAYTMSGKNTLKKLHRNIILLGLPVVILQWAWIVLWIAKGWWWLFVFWAAVAIPFGIWCTRYYYDKTAYICPSCHTVFSPSMKEFIFSAHTPSARKLTCTSCGHRGFCVETAKENPKG